jgi:heat-inducible transcriptional repressor
MGDLSERQKLILALIVKDHIENAQPVGSKVLVERYNLDFSSATVRNEMMALSEMGYLRQPHTSAGRVPTEAGYRYFVRQLMVHTEVPAHVQRTINHQFYQAGTDIEQWMRLAASVLAQQSQAAALVTIPQPDKVLFKHLELISTRGRQVLMILVSTTGEVHQQMLVLAEPVTQEQLSLTASHLSEQCLGLNAAAIARLPGPFNALEQDILKLILDGMRASGNLLAGEIYRDGLTNVLAEPEFAEIEVARRALRLLEERSLLQDLISRTMMSTKIGGVQVLIGGEGTWEELRECSVVLGRYGAPGLAAGTLGVLGPIRMSYGRTISTVRFVASVLSELLIDTLAEEEVID